MRIRTQFALTMWLCGLSLFLLLAQALSAQVSAPAEDFRHPADSSTHLQSASTKYASGDAFNLSDDNRLSIVAAALDARIRGVRDCSHLVHAVYQQAGLVYDYAPSSAIYAGVPEFRRVKRPAPGDLVVWRGHVGIVIKPSQHIFFSFLRSGPGTDDYDSPYWKHRGHPRFYRYINNCAECGAPHANPQRLMRTKR